jgi:hypothetical protein
MVWFDGALQGRPAAFQPAYSIQNALYNGGALGLPVHPPIRSMCQILSDRSPKALFYSQHWFARAQIAGFP